MVSVHKAELQRPGTKSEQLWRGDLIKGNIANRVKGDLIVDVGVEAFLPVRRSILVGCLTGGLPGKEDEFKIIKIGGERRNIVLQARDIEARAEQRAVLLEELEPMIIRHDKVKNITDFGAFVDLDSMDGLLHIFDMSWQGSDPHGFVQVKGSCYILEVDKGVSASTWVRRRKATPGTLSTSSIRRSRASAAAWSTYALRCLYRA